MIRFKLGKWVQVVGQGTAVVALLALSTSPAAGLWCRDECTAATDCWHFCATWYGWSVTCGEFGVCQEGQPPVYNMVSWMQQTYPGASSTHLEQSSGEIISEFSACNFASGFYRTNTRDGRYHERYTYDSTWIHFWREVFDASAAHFKKHDNFNWLKHYMAPMDSFTTDCSFREYNSLACTVPPKTPCSTTIRLRGPYLLALGGDIGTVEAIARTQDRGNGDVEWYYYAKPYGMVKFELRHSDGGPIGGPPEGSIVYSEVYNHIVSGEVTPDPSACFQLDC